MTIEGDLTHLYMGVGFEGVQMDVYGVRGEPFLSVSLARPEADEDDDAIIVTAIPRLAVRDLIGRLLEFMEDDPVDEGSIVMGDDGVATYTVPMEA